MNYFSKLKGTGSNKDKFKLMILLSKLLIEEFKKKEFIKYQMYIILILINKDWISLGMKIMRTLKIILIMVF